MQVAIDGPAGSGKSTVCKILANNYDLTYVDTGAMYRAAAWLSSRFPEINIAEEIGKVDFVFFNKGKNLSVSYNGETFDVTEVIRTPAVSEIVSQIAANPSLRQALVKKQQEYANANSVIMEGRDITTVVLPKADVKVYLTASPEERAKRRFEEWQNKNESREYEEVLQKMTERDKADLSRETSPLKQAEDAVLIDTTGLSLEDVCLKIGILIEKAIKY